jgi:hypothetical protein
MPSFKFTDNSPEGKAREELINNLLPKEPITGVGIHDKILKSTKKQAIEMLKQEIEIYRTFPKKGEFNPEIFTPRNSRQCFMGQGFRANGRGFEGWTDHDLVRYRHAVGTIDHPTWGNVTLLEIWGGDHFEKWPKMVKEVFLYGWGQRDTMPKVTFHISPWAKNDKSGTWDPDPDEIRTAEHREHLIKIAHYIEIRDRMKKAGVKSPMELAVDEKDDPVRTKRGPGRPRKGGNYG